MTSFDLATITGELKEAIVGSRIENIYQISPLTLLLVFYPRERLIVEAGRRIHLTSYDSEKPRSPSLFCMILRRLLNGGIVQEVSMSSFERIVSLAITSRESTYTLVCEIFGKGNIILVDGEGVILHALSYRRMRDREIIRGKMFKFPPSRGYDPLKITWEEFTHFQEQPGAVVQALSKLLTVGGVYAEEALLRANVDKEKSVSSVTKEEVEGIYNAVLSLVTDLTHGEPHIVLDSKGTWVDIVPFPLKKYSGLNRKNYSTYNMAADDYFTQLSLKSGNSVSEEIRKNIEEQQRILDKQKENLEFLTHMVDENRQTGDLIYLHISELQRLFQQIIEEKTRSSRWDKIVADLNEQKHGSEGPALLFEAIDPSTGILTVKINNSPIKVDLRKSIYENASSFYEEAKKMETKIEGVKKAIVQTMHKIDDFGLTQLRSIHKETPPLKIREKAWFERFHWALSSDNFLIIGGRDAATNELVIRKYMDSNDLVFHADISGAPFVILKTENKDPSEQTLVEAAQLAASYSRGWREGYASLDVYWVKPEQVSKQAPPGEYLTKGMFMIRGQRNYIHNVPLRISIGLLKKDEDLVIIGGPTAGISAQTQYRVDIVPGRHTSGTIAKSIQDTLAVMVTQELKERTRKIKIEDIQRFIPPGKSEIAIR